MDRIFLNKDQRFQYFQKLRKTSSLSWRKIAEIINVSPRSLFDWRQGKYSIPMKKACKISSLFKIEIPDNVQKRPKFWHIKKAAKLGGLARKEKHGNLGTMEGRRRGGRNSAKRRTVFLPQESTLLAEFIGIMLGDGNMSNYQASITLDLKRDLNYSHFIYNLINNLFQVKPSVYERFDYSTRIIVISSIDLIEFLTHKGLVVGNKMKQNIKIPKWILKNKNWQASCIRGLFDTDGSIYLDKHKTKGKIYKNLGMVFTSHSGLLLRDIKTALINLDYSPTDSSRNRVFLRRENEIRKYFKAIGTSNIKHKNRLNNFLMERCRSG